MVIYLLHTISSFPPEDFFSGGFVGNREMYGEIRTFPADNIHRSLKRYGGRGEGGFAVSVRRPGSISRLLKR